MKRIVLLADRASKAVAVAGLLLLLLVAAATLADGLHRAIRGTSINLVRDVGGLMTAIAIASCIPLSLLLRSHITIKVFEAMWPRSKAFVQFISDVVVLVVMCLFTWQFFVLSANLERAQETTFILSIPIAPFWYAASLILCCATIVQLAVTLLRISSPPADFNQ